MTSQETFVTRLRRTRERNRVALSEIAGATRINIELLEALERNDLSEWPFGLYARSYIRAYASVVGLDPASTVDEFCRLFPQGDRRAQPTMREIAAIVASPSEWRDEFGTHPDRRTNGTLISPAGESAFARSSHGLRAWLTRATRRIQTQIRLAGSRRQTS